ncbi:hypothetical protein GO730_32400 [Spirosoma sp. HMF3257]|uniref:Uncharacterized protein n=2 Tax=Spirosoma telluris TaxID=2183553 RepID=A0A327NQT0_9BACT|nr:hypothetical protein [Spirosoma telluris]RAI77652.1 hypothetical protein HMF3257_32300 [Spirosoma telluris]
MTGHRKFDYATMAFAYSALDFLTKPIDPVFLQKAVQKAQQRVKPEQYLKQIDLFMELIRSPDHKNTRLAVHLAGGIVEFITIDHILYLEADKATTTFILQDQTSLKSNRNLGQYDFLLQTHHNFFSISNSLLVNLNYIKRYDHREKAVTLTNGTVLYASRRGGQDLRHYMANQAVKPELDKNTILAFLKKLVL